MISYRFRFAFMSMEGHGLTGHEALEFLRSMFGSLALFGALINHMTTSLDVLISWTGLDRSMPRQRCYTQACG